MAEIKLNVPVGLTVGITPINSIDASNNATFNTLSVSGATTLGALSSSTLAVSGVATFSTIPTSPRPALNDNSRKLATTGWFFGQKAIGTPPMDGVAAIGNSTRWSPQNHVHPSDTSRLTVVNPSARGSIVVTGGRLTGSSVPVANLTQTWNNAATSFSGLKIAITNIASSVTSRAFDLNIGSNEFGIDVNGSIIQKLASPNIARDIVGATGIRHIREYQDLTDDGTQGLPGTIGISTDSIEWGFTWNAKWDTGSSTYIKDRSNVGDHAVMMRMNKKFNQEWWFSDGASGGSPIAWVNKIKFDFQNNAYTFAGNINTTRLTVTGATTLSSTLAVTGNLSVNTNKFNVIATNGNTRVAGTLGVTGATTLSSTLAVTGNISVNTNKFNVTARNGNTRLAGTLGVSGATTLSSTLDVTGNLSVNTNKFNVTAASGNTTLAGTLGVTGATTLSSTLGVTGATTLSSTLAVTGNLSVNTNKFNVIAASGNTTIAGTLSVSGNIETGTWNATTISTTKGGTGRTTIGTANQFLAVNAAGSALEYKSFTSSDSSLSITYPSAGLVDIKLVGTLPGNINFSGDLSVGGSSPNHKFLVLSATGNTDIKGTLGVTGKTTVTDLSSNTIALTDGSGDATLIAATTTTLVSAGTSTIATVPGTYKAVEFLVKCSVASAGAYQLIKLLAVNDGASTTAVTEFGNIEINDTGVSYDVTSTSGVMSLRATTTIANSVFTVIATSIK